MREQVGLEALKAWMRFKNVSQKELAEVVGLSHASLNQKINNKNGAEFSLSETIAIAEYLDLTADQVLRYFFSTFVA